MKSKKVIKAQLIAGLFFLALGGWLLHQRIHVFAMNSANYIPFISGIVSVFCLPLLFWFKPALALAYIINGFQVILGTIIMAHFAIAHFKGPVTPMNILLNTTFADIALLWAKFAVGNAIFGLEHLRSETDTAAKGRFFRYPNTGWWGVHLLALTIIYYLGNILWK
jgi:hypothetical protein